MLLSLPFREDQYLLFHKFKIVSLFTGIPFILLTNYECFFAGVKQIIPNIMLIVTFIMFFTVPFDIFLSLPVREIIVHTSLTPFVYHIAKANIAYNIYILIMVLSIVISIVYFFLSKTENKRISFVLTILGFIIAAFIDFSVVRGYAVSIMTSEFFVFIFIAFIFMDLLWEDRKIYVSVIELKDEAVRRLKITEIYTRKTLVESIERGNDPTKFLPNNVFIATLFTDIRDFTGISEGLQPLEVVDMLNSYFNRMNSTIIKHNGEIDKLMGDCIMALFKDPDNALRSAIEIRYELERFNLTTPQTSSKEREKDPQSLRGKLGRGVDNGIGLNYGEVIIGNIGSASKMDYTVVGDIVNTASRLEALTKYYKTPLIISEELKARLTDTYDIRFLDEALIKGKSTPVKIYEVYDFETDEKKETRARNIKPMQEAFTLYQSGDFMSAERIYNELAVRNGDPSLPFFLERCRNLQIRREAGLLMEWNGVFEFMDK